MKRLWQAFRYSMQGLIIVWRDEPAFRQESIIAVILFFIALYRAPDRLSLILLVGSIVLVLIIELLNTALEAAVDRFGGALHPLSKKAKDVASAAVFVSILNMIFVWLVIFIEFEGA